MEFYVHGRAVQYDGGLPCGVYVCKGLCYRFEPITPGNLAARLNTEPKNRARTLVTALRDTAATQANWPRGFSEWLIKTPYVPRDIGLHRAEIQNTAALADRLVIALSGSEGKGF